ncbi:MAG: tRNA pseudouridine(55) synthase TruB [Firmicutes bacterium]|nr:tRNA pseudouridine(55) synthase TruB [Bacillota bacterium]
MNGFVNVIKPVGATASDVAVCLKHVLREKKVGHLGTLDPGASGVLPVAVGQATRLFDYLTDKVKVYRAFFTFGKTTDTLDSYGAVRAETGPIPELDTVLSVLKRFTGELDQIPPVYSAKSVGGVRAYKLAREGILPELKPRRVIIYGIDLISQKSADTFVFDIRCGGGTYIRSLARDIACACGTVGYMSGLIRLQSGSFTIDKAYTLDEVRELKEKCVVPITEPLSDVETYCLDDKYFDDINCGRKVRCTLFVGYRKIYCKDVFFGLGRSYNGFLKLDYYLKNAL